MTHAHPADAPTGQETADAAIGVFADLSPELHTAFAQYQAKGLADPPQSMTPKCAALVSLAVALAIPDSALADTYLDRSAGAGATEEEIAESVYAAAALRAGATISYGQLAFKLLDQPPGADLSFQFHERSDGRYAKDLRRGNEEAFAAVLDLMTSLHMPSRVLPPKYYELMALAVALTTQCVYCIDKHVVDARKQGASDGEIADAVHIAGTLRIRSTLLAGAAALQRRRGAA